MPSVSGILTFCRFTCYIFIFHFTHFPLNSKSVNGKMCLNFKSYGIWWKWVQLDVATGKLKIYSTFPFGWSLWKFSELIIGDYCNYKPCSLHNEAQIIWWHKVLWRNKGIFLHFNTWHISSFFCQWCALKSHGKES